MDCSLLQEDLCAYVDNELDEEARARVQAHLVECDACAEEMGAFRAIRAVVSRLKLHEENPPQSLQAVARTADSVAGRGLLSWLRRPIPGYAVALAAAAVLVTLFGSWSHYEGAFIRRGQQRDAIWAHLRAVSSICLQDPGAVTRVSTTSLPAVAQGQPVALREGAATIGVRAALHTVYLVGDEAVSQFRFAPAHFRTGNLSRYTLAERVYRVGRVGDYSIASYEEPGAQIVLVSSTSPEALLILAQNIPSDTPFDPPDVGY